MRATRRNGAWALRAIVLAAVTLLTPRFAFAQHAQDVPAARDRDVLVLRDGTVLYGTVEFLVPGVVMRVRLITGTRATVRWTDLDSFAGPSFAGRPLPAPSASGDEFDDPRVPGPDRVALHIDAGGDERQIVGIIVPEVPEFHLDPTEDEAPHRDLCFTPCTLYVRPGPLRLYVGTEAQRREASVAVPTTGLVVRLHSGVRPMWYVGVALLMAGTIAATLGGTIALIGASSDPTAFDAGMGVFVGGIAALMAPGVVLMITLHGAVESSHPISHAATESRTAQRWSFGIAPTTHGLTLGVRGSF